MSIASGDGQGLGQPIRVGVELAERRYDVLIGRGIVSLAGGMVPPVARRVAIVTQETVANFVSPASLGISIPYEIFLVKEGEEAKSMRVLEELLRGFAKMGLSRSDLVVALGGGVVTDLAGFAAACYHRGVAYVNVATTLLAQVDAAIGGKTAVNLPEGKNLVGAFWQPRLVICDTATLDTLPESEWASGRGEMAKYAFLGEALGFPALGIGILELSLEEQVARCVELKAAVVVEDEREGGKRALLNYGHTLAHALEAFALSEGIDLRHGEAVGMGLVFAAELAHRLGRIGEDRVEVHRQVVSGFGLRTSLRGLAAGLDPEMLVSYMGRDKKAHHDLSFVLEGPEGLELVRSVPADAVLDCLKGLLEIPAPACGEAGS
jgi:5-deoxy-5-amino-3-dehydroquinate synthase